MQQNAVARDQVLNVKSVQIYKSYGETSPNVIYVFSPDSWSITPLESAYNN